MVKTKGSILAAYNSNVAEQQTIVSNLKSKLNEVSLSRLGAFIAEILVVALMISYGFHWTFGIMLLIPVLGFLYLVKKQAALQLELDYAVKLLWIYENEVGQILSRKNGYDNGESFADESHPYASDLDVVGAGSLFALINRCKTDNGMRLLGNNLLNANTKDTIVLRQEAIEELNEHIDQTFHFRAQLQDHNPQQLTMVKDKLQHQLPKQLAFTEAPILKLYVAAVPFLTLALFIIAIVFNGVLWSVFGLLALVNVAITFFNLAATNQVYYGFSGSSNLLNSFSGTIKWTEEVNWKSSYINSLFKTVETGATVSDQIKKLASIITAFDARLNVFLAAILNIFLLWDLRCAIRLAKWHKASSGNLVEGLYRISQFEELISLATLRYNEPDWVFPVIDAEFGFSCAEIGHPLIPEQVRVPNDFHLFESPTTDVVTGSNMAGKSTFLRTVGINMVLAFAGAPVCAERFNSAIFNLLSYMRIKDSLNDQTSTFKAELNRLKMILDVTATNPHSFVLIDEMLRGTNSRDKYLGSKVFIEKLISQRTPALFATHDLQLSEMEADYTLSVRNYHFDIQISEGQMNFDYKLKHGPCKTFNAALLLKEIGLSL
ncbi:MAG: DNA mismatch repair protein MutS [Bacteroidota bacterium]